MTKEKTGVSKRRDNKDSGRKAKARVRANGMTKHAAARAARQMAPRRFRAITPAQGAPASDVIATMTVQLFEVTNQRTMKMQPYYAESAEAAIDLAMRDGLARKRENLTAADFTNLLGPDDE